MTPERFQLISQIYHAALECTPANRAALLDQQCGHDTDLRNHVESLLAGGKRAEALLLSMAMKESVRRLTDEPMRPLIGQTLDHYEVLSLIGTGGMGEVYRAHDINLGRDVAIKILPRGFSSETERRRFEREARAASALNHPNILTIHEIEQVEDTRFMVSEFIAGETLRHRLLKGRMTLKESLEIAIQIASALAAAHAAGIVHRDIKPENIMLRQDDLVKVLDFGLAKVAEPAAIPAKPDQSTLEVFHTDPGIVVGTSSYMSPEQTRGLAIDERTDIWSLGVVLFEMVTGSQPFGGATKSDVIVSILEKDSPPIGAEIPHHKALTVILDKALKKERTDRYQTAREFLDDLKQLKQQMDTQTEGFVPIRPTPASIFSKPVVKVVILTAIVVVVAVASYKVLQSSRSAATPPTPKSIPFTTFSGREQQPTFSPDGNQIAFAWNGPKGDNFDIYIKLVNSEATPLRLTTDPADDIYPAWSPDGRSIAFVRHVGPQINIYTVSALGGSERKLYSGNSAFYSLYEFGNALSWSPDGKYLAFSQQSAPHQPNGIFLLSMDTLEAHRLTTPPEGFLGDSTPAFSPDGKLLAFVRGASSRDVEVYVMPVEGGEPKRLTFDNRSGRSLAWTADSKWIVFSSWFYGGLKLFKVEAAGGTPQQLDVGTEFASTLAISRQGNRLAYSQEFRDTNIWRIDLHSRPIKKDENPVISSTRQDYAPQYSPDNKKIAFTSGRSGSNEIWVCDADGQNPTPLTSFGGPDVGSPRWSPDGQLIAFDSLAPGHRDIYIVGVQSGKPHRLTGDNFDNVRPSFSRDGHWIYFGSNRTGDWQLWKAPAEGGQPVQITHRGGREGVESPDGTTVYYNKGFGTAGLWKVPTAGGDETLVIEGVHQGFWGLLNDGVYFLNPDATPHAIIEYYNFANLRTTKIAEVEKDLQLVYPSLAVSSDGQSLLYVQADSFGSDIMLVEDFH